MKKITLIIILLIIPFKVTALSAEAAIVMDQDSKRVLFAKNLEKEKLIASTTKIMTAIVTIENCSLKEKVTVDDRVLKAYGSAIYLSIGEEITIEDLLYGLMLRSGNDAALVIANYFSDKKQDFVVMMNEKADELKMNDTIFFNAHGLEENDGSANTSTVYDMATLMSYAMNNESFRTITKTKKYTAKTSMKSYTWNNKNKLLGSYLYATGGKTGYTKLAKRTLVTSASKDDKNLVIVTFNDGNDFDDHKKLYEEYFNKYSKLVVINKNNFKIRNEGYYSGVNFYVKNNYEVLVTDDEKKNVKLDIVLDKNDKFKDNQIIGKASVLINNKLIHEEDIYIVRKSSVKKQSVWSKIKKWF